MNDFEIDELASAYLDDAVTDEERARVDADPALRSRVDELRRARDALRGSTVEPAAADARDSAIARALAVSPVVDLQEERAARARRRVRVASIAAAAILIVGVAGMLLRSASRDGSTKSSTAAAASSSSSSGAAAAAGASAPLFTTVTHELGVYADRDALVVAVETASSAPTTATQAAGAANDAATPRAAESTTSSRCAASTPPDAVSKSLSDSAVLAGAPVQVDVFVLHDGSRRLVVTSVGTCALVFTQTL